MAIRQRGAAWQADVFISGKRTRKDFATEADAAVWVESVKVKPTGPSRASTVPSAGPLSPGMWTLRKACDDTFARYWKGGKHEVKQEQLMERVVADLGPNTALSDLDTMAMDAYITDLKRQGKSAATINHRLSIVSRALKFALARGVKFTPPSIEREKVFNERMAWLSEEDEATILSLLRRWGKDEHEEVITVLIDTGMRHSELFALEGPDVTIFSREGDGKLSASILINKSIGERSVSGVTKNGVKRTIYATERVALILKRRFEEHDKGRLFPYSNQWLRQAWDRVRSVMGRNEDQNFVSYICRHTCASRMVQRGVPIPVIQRHMGHKTIQMTMRYANVAPANMMEAAAAMEGAWK